MLKKLVILIFIVVSVFLLALLISLATELSLGDEAYHYRFAKNFYLSGGRPVVDILYMNSDRPEYIYVHDILWHFVLAKIWTITGGISFIATQIYQTSYYVLLIFLTYLLGRKFYGKEAGLYSALLVATVPMVAVFSILFYTDIAGVVFSVLCILLVVKKKYFWAGIALALMYMSKRNSLLLMPAIPLIIFYDKVSLKAKFKNALILFAVASLVILPDLYWREKTFKDTDPSVFTSINSVLHAAAKPLSMVPTGDATSFANIAAKDIPFLKYFHNYLFLSYFGLALILGLAFYFVHKYKWYKKKDIVLWTLILVYVLFYFYFLGFSKEVRYMLPIVPFLAILVSRSIAFTKKKFVKIVIICICMLQLFATAGYVSTKRRIPQGLNDAFTYIKENTSPDSEILYLEYIGLEMMDRKIRWSADLGLLHRILWGFDAKEVSDAINKIGVDYILVRKSRIYKDTDLRYIGGYPESFVERFPTFPFIGLVFENDAGIIWKVNRDTENIR